MQTEKFDFIINRLSGTVLHTGEEGIRTGLNETFGDKIGNILFVDGKDVAATVKAWVAENAGKGRGMVIGGGDGTVLTAAIEILGRTDINLGVLPMGTHNLFARQLGFAADFRKASAQYKNSEPASIDVGTVNGMHFLVGLMIDRNCVNFYGAREDLRIKKRMPALKKLFNMLAGGLFGRRQNLAVTTTPDKTEDVNARIFFVMNNQLEPRPMFAKPKDPEDNPGLAKNAVENLLARGNHNDGVMALYALKAGPVSTFTIAASLVKGTWTGANSVKTVVAPEMTIAPKGDKANDKLTVILDGEFRDTQYPLNVKIIPSGLRVFKPAA